MLLRNSYLSLPEILYQRTPPIAVESPELIVFNQSLGMELNIDLGEGEFDVTFFAGNKLPKHCKPIALAYAGHQFGQFVPQLGDGRAHLLGQLKHQEGQDYDVQLKGSGRTVYSRNGDGRAPLDAVIREYMISEFMHAVGIPTTRSLAAVKSEQVLWRHNGMVPAGVLTRVASSHIRIGSFEYLARQGKLTELRRLYQYTIARHFPELTQHDDKFVEFFSRVCTRQASLIAEWMLIGFIHGVMNTDNMAISGETIDYGPCAFMDEYDPQTVFSSIDSYGRYAFSNQAAIGAWNLSRLAECLLFLGGNSEQVREQFNIAIDDYQAQLKRHWTLRMQQKLGLISDKQEHLTLIQDYLDILQENRIDYTSSFRILADVLLKEDSKTYFLSMMGEKARAKEWLTRWLGLIDAGKYSRATVMKAMNANNPLIIPRNHVIQAIIDNALHRQDFELFHQFIDAIKSPFEDKGCQPLFQSQPLEQERVRQTFCGT